MEDLSRLTVNYQVKPLGELLGDLVDLQDTVFSLLEQRQRPNQARQLYFAAG